LPGLLGWPDLRQPDAETTNKITIIVKIRAFKR
jgi:hypothetical protein